MRKELGKWLMDIAKYIITAIILTSVFGEAEPLVLYFGGGLAVIITLAIGLFLVSGTSVNMNRRNRNNTQNR